MREILPAVAMIMSFAFLMLQLPKRVLFFRPAKIEAVSPTASFVFFDDGASFEIERRSRMLWQRVAGELVAEDRLVEVVEEDAHAMVPFKAAARPFSLPREEPARIPASSLMPQSFAAPPLAEMPAVALPDRDETPSMREELLDLNNSTEERQ